MSESRYWRIRMKYGGEELTRKAWERNEVGIWYGSWTTEELETALESESPLPYLSKANRRHGLDWKVPSNFLKVAERFRSIGAKDWVFVYFDGKLGLAKISSDVRSSAGHPLNRGGESFKFRNISRKKTFSLNSLPDAFRLLPAAGRGNVFQPRGSGELVKLLGDAANDAGVTRQLESKSLDEFLKLLGPSSWESVCEAYLIMEHHFVPTGLSSGGTLQDFDVVGRRSTDGARILAQCKKNPEPVLIDDGFIDAIGKPGASRIAFYFAFGGCSGKVPSHVRVVDQKTILHWSKTRAGTRYFEWLRGG
jgi:hypothetical protein